MPVCVPPEADPSLLVHYPTASAMGLMSADMLLERIGTPDLPYRCSFVKTTPIWRDSVRQPFQL